MTALCDGCGYERADVGDYAGGNYCPDCIASCFDDEPRRSTPMSFHRQVVLPELGFSVDEGLEDLIRACWRRGIATCGSCIGGSVSVPGPDALIVFSTLGHAFRWHDLTGRDVDYPDDEYDRAHPDEESIYSYGAEFPPSDFPALVEALETVDCPDEYEAFLAAVRQRNATRYGGTFASSTVTDQPKDTNMTNRGNPDCKCSLCRAPHARRWEASIGGHVYYCPEHYDELAAVRDDPFAFEVRRRRIEAEVRGATSQ